MRDILVCTLCGMVGGYVVVWTGSEIVGMVLIGLFGMIAGIGLLDARIDTRQARDERDALLLELAPMRAELGFAPMATP